MAETKVQFSKGLHDYLVQAAIVILKWAKKEEKTHRMRIIWRNNEAVPYAHIYGDFPDLPAAPSVSWGDLCVTLKQMHDNKAQISDGVNFFRCVEAESLDPTKSKRYPIDCTIVCN
jgi:hypothetical protein